jgi:hypothetical protein
MMMDPEFKVQWQQIERDNANGETVSEFTQSRDELKTIHL